MLNSSYPGEYAAENTENYLKSMSFNHNDEIVLLVGCHCIVFQVLNIYLIYYLPLLQLVDAVHY